MQNDNEDLTRSRPSTTSEQGDLASETWVVQASLRTIPCSVCDRAIDEETGVCGDCYDAGRKPLPDPVTLKLSRDDCHQLLGYLMIETTKDDAPLTRLRIRFFEALEAAAN